MPHLVLASVTIVCDNGLCMVALMSSNGHFASGHSGIHIACDPTTAMSVANGEVGISKMYIS